MKKTSYIGYLNEYQGKMPIQVEKTFKHTQKSHKPKLLRVKQDSRKKAQCLHANQSDNNQTKPFHGGYNKQNLHPNIPSQHHPLTNRATKTPIHYNSHSIHNKPNISPFSQISPQPNNTKTNTLKQISVSLNRCNLQPSHQSSILYLVYWRENNMQLIVCQECSRQFSDKVSLSEFRSSRRNNSTQKAPQYKLYVDQKIQLQQQNDKLNAISSIQSYNLNLTLNKIRQYYNSIIRSIEAIRCQLEESIIQVYRYNVQHLEKLEKRNIGHLKWLEKEIQNLEEACKSQKNLRNMQNYRKEPLSIDNIGEDMILRQVELLWTDSSIRSGLDKEFDKWFRQSKFYVEVQVNSSSSVQSKKPTIPQQLQHSYQQSSQHDDTEQIPQQQQQQYQQQGKYQHPQPSSIQQPQPHQTSPNPSTINLKQLLPFTVSFPTTQSKVMEIEDNFSNRLSYQLNNVQSEELLIQSLRGDEAGGEGWGQGNNMTRSQMWRQAESYRLGQIVGKEDKLTDELQKGEITGSCSRNSPKGNFIKQLHKISMEQIQESIMGHNQGLLPHNEGFSDLLCDQDLTIYQNPLVKFKNKPSTSINKKDPNTPQTLPISYNRPYISNKQKQPQTNPTTQNPLTIANQTNHQISFEIDQNLIIDNDILPIEQTSPQNLDIISPAFKVI